MAGVMERHPDEPVVWYLAFYKHSVRWWVRSLVPGRFKHVAAFAWSPAARTWVWYDVGLTDTRIVLLPEGKASLALLAHLTERATVLKIAASNRGGRRFRVGFWCTVAVAHLVGLRSGALRPTALWRDCLRNGAEAVLSDFASV